MAAAALKEAMATSLVGAQVEYLRDKFSTTTKILIVVDYDRIAKLNVVKEQGKAVTRCATW